MIHEGEKLPYRAVIQRNGKRWNLGTHTTRAEAETARNEARKALARTGDVAGQRASKYQIRPVSTVITAGADFREAARTAHDAALRTREKLFWLEIVKLAIADLRPSVPPEHRATALDWIMSGEFDTVCDHLFEYDANVIRERILRQAGIHIVSSQLRLVFPRKENVG